MTYVPPKRDCVVELEIDGVVYRQNDVVGIDGVAGEFKVRHFEVSADPPQVEAFGGHSGRRAIRTFYAHQIIPPTGTNPSVERRVRELAPDTIRDAIAADGRVVVTLANPKDQVERKRTVNKVFSRSYSLGLKGKFKVRVEGPLVIGERTE